VIWPFFSNTVLSDTSTGPGFEIDTSRADAQVRGLVCSGCWISASQTSHGVVISNTAGAAKFGGLHFLGARIYSNQLTGITINHGTDISIEASYVCGNSVGGGGANGIAIAANVNNVKIIGGSSGGTCDQMTTTQGSGIFLAGPNAGVFIADVDLSQGNSAALNGGAGVVGRYINNPGFNPVGALNVTTTASPMTYTAGNVSESLCLVAGTVSNVAVGAFQVAATSNVCIALGPHQAAVITYSVPPILTTLRQ
jgi:hypothetical protein